MKIRKNEAKWIESKNRWQINVTNSDGERRTFCSSVGLSTRKGKLQAERKADDWLENGLNSTSTRVEEVFQAYIQYISETTSTGNWKPYQCIGKNWILPVIGRKKVGAVTEGDCEQIIASAYKAGRTKKYICNIRACISNFLKYCRKRNLTRLLPEELSIPKGAKEKGKNILAPEEIRVLFKDTDWWFIHAYRFLLLSDLRPGELLGLKWEDINGDVFSIKRSRNDYNEITDGKNFNARRTLKMCELAQKEIIAQRDLLKNSNMVSPWVFPDRSGSYSTQKTFRQQWYIYCDQTGIGQRGITTAGNKRYITPYEFRHTCYSVSKEMPEALRKMAFGHSRKFDGDAVYSHEMDGDREKIAMYTDEAFGKIISGAKT